MKTEAWREEVQRGGERGGGSVLGRSAVRAGWEGPGTFQKDSP